MKTSKKIKDEAKLIAEIITNPIYSKRLTLLVGSGINFNIAKGAKDWSSLAVDSIKTFFKKEKKYYSEFERDAISLKVFKNIENNKIALSFSDSISLDKITALTQAENKWFKEGYLVIRNAMKNKVKIVTLNYDVILEEVLSKKSINLLNDEEEGADEYDDIFHLHGLVNSKNVVSGNALLTLLDYVKYSKKVEDKLVKILNISNDNKGNKELDNGTWQDTIIIIGTSLTEEHILRAFRNVKKNRKASLRILLVCHLPKSKNVIAKLKSIYDELTVELVNINSSGNYNDDFKAFWNCLSLSIKRNSSNFIGGISKGDFDDIDETSFYFKIKSKLNNGTSLTISDLFKKLDIEPKNPSEKLIRALFWLEQDGIIRNGELEEYFFSFAALPLQYLYFISRRRNQLENKKIDKIFNSFEEKVEFYSEYGNNDEAHQLLAFTKKYMSELDINKHPKIISHLLRRVIIKYGRVDKTLSTFLVNKFSLKDLINSDMFFNFVSIGDNDDNFVKLILNTIEKEHEYFGFKLPQKKEDIKRFLSLLSKKEQHIRLNKIALMIILKTEKYKYFFFEEIDTSIDFLDKMIKSDEEGINKSNIWNIYLLLCYLYLNSSMEEKFVNKIRKFHNTFDRFPSRHNYYGTSISDDELFSKYDGQALMDKPKVFKSWDEIEEMVAEKGSVLINDAKGVINFLSNNHNNDDLDRLFKIEKLKSIHLFYDLPIITIELDDIKNYLNYKEMRRVNKLSYYDYGFLVVNLPYKIEDKLNELIKKIELESDDNTLEKIKNIILIKVIDGYYSTDYNIWYNKELNQLMELYWKDENKIIKEIINIIFEKTFKWEKDYFIKLKSNSCFTTWYEMEFLIRYGELSKEKIPNANEVIGLFRKLNGKNRWINLENALPQILARINVESRSEYCEHIIDFMKKELKKNHTITREMKSYIIWNFIVNEIDFTIKSDIKQIDVVNEISRMNDETFNKNKERIEECFGKSMKNDDIKDVFQLIAFLGDKVYKANNIYKALSSQLLDAMQYIQENQFIMHKERVKKFIYSLKTNKNKILTLIKNKKIKL